MMNYKPVNAYEKIEVDDIPAGTSIILSHHFFQIRYDEEAGKLKWKCRQVPHGNSD